MYTHRCGPRKFLFLNCIKKISLSFSVIMNFLKVSYPYLVLLKKKRNKKQDNTIYIISNYSLKNVMLSLLYNLSSPVDPKVKFNQNILNTHCVALKFGYRRMSYLSICNMYFHVDDLYAKLLKPTWNLFRQFPKHIEDKSFYTQTDEFVVIEPSD